MEKDWEDEVLMASECGFEGLACCPEEPRCLYGQQCCVSPRDQSLHYCAETCEFGILNSYCRASDPLCDDGLACQGQKCAVCGHDNAPCCGQSCDPGLTCHLGQCLECGLSGNPCCGEGECRPQENEMLECLAGVCRPCGTDSLALCQSEPKCLEGNLEAGGICISCGLANQPCCQKDGKPYCREDQLACELGFCGAGG